MGFDPINPVALVGCAGAGVGSACARELSQRADGGLILIDNDEDSLAAAADALVRPPEKVSMLALDPADASRWRDAAEFIAGQYGRLDWAFLDAGASFPRRDNYLDAARCGLEAILPLIGDNRDGGAIVFLTSAAALRQELDQRNGFMTLLRHAAREGAELQVRVSALAFGGPVEFLVAGSGHIAGVINHPDARKYQYWTNKNLKGAIEDWFAFAHEHPGSWWPYWDAWLKTRAGPDVPARTPGEGKLKPICDAPGEYVRVRSS